MNTKQIESYFDRVLEGERERFELCQGLDDQLTPVALFLMSRNPRTLAAFEEPSHFLFPLLTTEREKDRCVHLARILGLLGSAVAVTFCAEVFEAPEGGPRPSEHPDRVERVMVSCEARRDDGKTIVRHARAPIGKSGKWRTLGAWDRAGLVEGGRAARLLASEESQASFDQIYAGLPPEQREHGWHLLGLDAMPVEEIQTVSEFQA